MRRVGGGVCAVASANRRRVSATWRSMVEAGESGPGVRVRLEKRMRRGSMGSACDTGGIGAGGDREVGREHDGEVVAAYLVRSDGGMCWWTTEAGFTQGECEFGRIGWKRVMRNERRYYSAGHQGVGLIGGAVAEQYVRRNIDLRWRTETLRFEHGGGRCHAMRQ